MDTRFEILQGLEKLGRHGPRLLTALAIGADDDGVCRVSKSKLASCLGVKFATITRQAARLAELGLIKVESGQTAGGRLFTHCHLLRPGRPATRQVEQDDPASGDPGGPAVTTSQPITQGDRP